MRTSPAHVAPEEAAKRRRRTTRFALASAVAVTLGGSGIYIANANAAETVVPGRVQAEAFAAQSGAQTEGTGDADGGKNVGWLAAGDWLRFDNVAITSKDLTARVASDNSAGGSIELHLGSQTGALLATIPVTRTGGWQKWATVKATGASVPTGGQTVFAVMKSAQQNDFVNLNWFTFGAAGTPSAPASSSTPAPVPTTAAPTPTGGTPSGDGWVTMDKAKWEAQLAAFTKMTPKAVPAGNVRVPEFNASCTVSHSKPDDPIVFPGLAGASHMHTFMGNDSTDANTTTMTLLENAGSSCKPGEDRSAYWIPELTENGKKVDPHGVTVYYGSRLKDPAKTVPFPQGFRMIVGDAKKQIDTPKGAPGQFWCAGAGGETGRSTDGNWPVCAKTAELTFQLTFPDCWDGVHLDSPDHKSHIGGTGPDGTCASGKFPVAIPSLSFVIGYPTSGSPAGFKLASGNASSMHGDAFFAWDDEALGSRVKNCIVQKAKCDSFGNF
ncbi:DUF1996 domain-containing protein [Actinoplanes friuliensis]|uniref:CBM6 domain-containing protein n=1 Tax=Actinoplanes friuliensis DSM 7358 TaxID=1246995 RepID=U5W9C2_9ACTN|nr:DUF1996 domain-containing protein [Actinoplanes friuliensis]AGZ44565.1 hypothetical protein AFR_31525 [Actinoplanes friuliensis DSM 7358]